LADDRAGVGAWPYYGGMAPPPPDRARDLLARPDFLKLWLVGAFANAMRWLELLASGLFAYQVTESAFAVAAVVAARQLPQLLFGALAGAIAEAVNRRTILLVALILPAAISATIAVLAVTEALQLWQIALANFACGTLWASEMSTRRRMVGESAGADRVGQAIALDSTTSAGTRLAGPLLGGIAFEWLGMASAYTLTAAVQALCAVAVLTLAYRQRTAPIALAQLPRDIAEGLAFARTQPDIMLVFAITVVMNAFAFSYTGLVAPLGQGEFGVSPALVGVLAAAEPLGALLGGVLLATGRVRPDGRRAFVGGTFLFMVALLALAASPGFALAFAALALGGLGTAGFGNMQSTLVLTGAPPHLRSRLMGVVTVCIGTGPLGVLVAGALAEAVGTRTAIATMAGLGIVLTAAAVRRYRRP